MPPATRPNRRPRANPFERANRCMLAHAEVLSVVLNGGAGCGKSSLIDATVKQLGSGVRVGVISCDVIPHRDSGRFVPGCEQRTRIVAGPQGLADAQQIHEALQRLDLHRIDLLFIENIGTLSYRWPMKLGQDVTVAVFSVAGGHDKPSIYTDLVESADAVILNKSDLLSVVPFERSTYRSDVRRINPNATLLELSALHGQGLDQWADWLRLRVKRRETCPSAAFG